MRILVLNYEYPPLGGGAAPVARDICEQLVLNGHRVDVVTMGYNGLKSEEEQNGVIIHRVKCIRKSQFKCMPWEQLTYIVSAKRYISKLLSEKEYDICHTHFVIPTGAVSRWLNDKYGIPVIITAHGSDVEGYNSKRYIRWMHFALRRSWKRIVDSCYKVVSPSEYLCDLMMKAYKRENLYTVIPNGIDLNKYCMLTKENKKKKVILLMGRMQEYKNFQTVLRALSLIELNDWVVYILGDGPYRKELESISRELHLDSKVIFMGWVDHSCHRQLDILSCASIYITASRFENCPMSVLETVASGCYPLLSDIPAHRQLLCEDEFYFDAEDSRQLAMKIENRMHMGANCYKYDLRRFSWKNVINQYNTVFEEAKQYNS